MWSKVFVFSDLKKLPCLLPTASDSPHDERGEDYRPPECTGTAQAGTHIHNIDLHTNTGSDAQHQRHTHTPP